MKNPNYLSSPYRHSLMFLKEKPFVLLLYATIMILFALILCMIANIDFKDKVMFGLPLETVIWIIPLVIMILWLLYLRTRKFLYSTTITWLHILITVITAFLIMTVMLIGIIPNNMTSDRHELIGNAMQILSSIFVLGQLLYLVNVGSGILLRKM